MRWDNRKGTDRFAQLVDKLTKKSEVHHWKQL